MSIGPKEIRKRFLLRVAGVRNEKVYIGPETVHLHITNKCNLRCLFCWGHAPGGLIHQQPPRHLSFKKFAGIVRDCYDLKVEAVHLSAEGEPSLHPRFSDMMDLLGKMPFLVKLLTNGTFAPQQRGAVQKADQVVINLGAADRGRYRILHGNDCFEKVIENLRSLVHFRDHEKKSLGIKVLFIKNKLNAGDLPAMRVLAGKLGVVLLEKEMMPTLHNKKIMLPRKVSRNCQGKIVPPCYYGWFYASITLQEDVSLCCYINNTGGTDIKDISFKEAWHAPSLMRRRLEAAKGLLLKEFQECRSCPAAMVDAQHRPPLKGIVPGSPGLEGLCQSQSLMM